jgi:diguanylate cyclase (GGDEF)-like protein
MAASSHSSEDADKTSIVASDTFKGRMKAADDAPPAVVILIGPPGYVGKQWTLATNDVVIGRSVDCPIFVDDRSVSKNHARFNVVGADVTVVDLGSTNKTMVNGEILQPLTPFKLSNNDQIKTGNVIFKFLEKGNIEAVTHREMNERVQKDALTGAYNKAALMEKGPESIKRAEFLNEPLSIITFDIDFFKKVNDTYGHPAGDYVLKELSRIVSTKVVRSQDLFARYGGEEFVIILNGTPLKTSQEIAERLRSTIESSHFEFESKHIPVTISVGLSTRKDNEGDWQKIYKRADEALYISKKTGRNKVTVS